MWRFLAHLRIGLCAIGFAIAMAVPEQALAAGSALFKLDQVQRQVQRVDPTDGSVETIATLSPDRFDYGLTTWPPGSRQLVTLSYIETPGPGLFEYCIEGQRFERIDTATGAVDTVLDLDPVALGLPEGMQLVPFTFAISSLEPDVAVVAGFLFPIGCGQLGTNIVHQLFFVDLDTGEPARPPVALSPNELTYHPSALAFSPEGVLFASFDSGGHEPLGTIDPETGEIHEIAGSAAVGALAFQPATNALFAYLYDSDVGQAAVVVLDPASGTVTATLASTGPDVNPISFAAARPSAIPALGTLGEGVLVASLAWVGARRRRDRGSRRDASRESASDGSGLVRSV